MADAGKDQNEIIKQNLCTDYQLYESILFHLLQNAIKYSPSHTTVKVVCFFKPIKQKDSIFSGYLVTKVKDRGPGLDVGKRLKSYKTFSQCGLNQTKNQTAGVGIGLSTAQALTKYLGGELKVKSSNQGTLVKFSVLVCKEHNIAKFSREI